MLLLNANYKRDLPERPPQAFLMRPKAQQEGNPLATQLSTQTPLLDGR